MYVCKCVCLCVYMCAYLCVCVCARMHVHMSIAIKYLVNVKGGDELNKKDDFCN